MEQVQTCRWIETGAGAPVVFLNGIFGTLEDWRAALDASDPRWRFVVPEIPLFDAVVREASIAEVARHVIQFLDAMRFDEVVLGGNSIGGQVALAVALRHPGRISGLILSGASGAGEHQIGTISHRPSTQYVRSQVAHVLDRPGLVDDERIESIRRTLGTSQGLLRALRYSRACRSERVVDSLGDVRCPALLVWGMNDRITPRWVAERFHAGLPQSDLVVVPDAAHAPMLEQPAAFAAAVNAWLADIGWGAAGISRERSA